MVCSITDKSIPTLGSGGSCWWSPPTQKQLSDLSVTEHRGNRNPPADATELSATSLRCVLIRSEAVSLHWCLGGGTKHESRRVHGLTLRVPLCVPHRSSSAGG